MTEDDRRTAMIEEDRLEAGPTKEQSKDEPRTRRPSMSNVKPLEDRILVKPAERETKTASGIFLPESSKERPVQGKVVAVGPGRLLENGKRADMAVKKGDTIVYGKYSGTEVEIKDTKHLILKESEVLGIVE